MPSIEGYRPISLSSPSPPSSPWSRHAPNYPWASHNTFSYSIRNYVSSNPRIRILAAILLIPTIGSLFVLLAPTAPTELDTASYSPPTTVPHSQSSGSEPLHDASSSWTRPYDYVKSLLGLDDSRPLIPGEDRLLPMDEFLERHLPDRTKRLWMTLADERFAEASTAHLALFLDNLNEQESRPGGSGIRTELLVICSDDGCLRICDERRWVCYEAYRHNRPEIMLEHTWPKLRGVIDILQTGRDLYFVDSDVFFRENPYPYMPDPRSSDIQIQEDLVGNGVNTGWWHMRSTPSTISLWQAVLDRDLKSVSRDQANFNDLLQSTSHRTPALDRNGTAARIDGFESRGVSVKVMDPTRFRAYHFEWLDPGMDKAGSVVLHTTCTGDWFYKSYIAGAYGYWQDLDGYYSRPPPLITTHAIHGTAEEVLQQWRILLYIARATGRALMPPLEGYVTDKGRRPPFPFITALPSVAAAAVVARPHPAGASLVPMPIPIQRPAHHRRPGGRVETLPNERTQRLRQEGEEWMANPVKPLTLNIWSMFPMEDVEQMHGVKLVEPGYSARAAAYAHGRTGKDGKAKQAWDWAVESEQDVRTFKSADELVMRLKESEWEGRSVLRLAGWQYDGNWREWKFGGAEEGGGETGKKESFEVAGEEEAEEWQREAKKARIWEARTCDLERYAPSCNRLCWV